MIPYAGVMRKWFSDVIAWLRFYREVDMRKATIFISGFWLLASLCCVTSAAEHQGLEQFLIAQGMNTGEFGYTLQDFQTVPNDPFTIPRVMSMLNDPLLIPEFVNASGEYYLENSGKIGNLLRKCAKDSGSYLWRDQPALQEAEGESAYELFSPGTKSRWESNLAPLLKNIPEDEQLLWVRFFASCEQFMDYRAEALRNVPGNQWDEIHMNAVDFMLSDEFVPGVYDACSTFDFDSLYRGAIILVDAFDALRAGIDVSLLPSMLGEGFYETPIGWVVVTGDETRRVTPDVYESIFLVINIEGDSKHKSYCRNSSLDMPIRILWDITGNDTYDSSGDGGSGQAAGILGIALLVDESGDDVYTTKTFGQGAGAFGVGILYDASGDDKYYGDEAVQGAGIFGVGILADIGGDDEYSCLFGGQGFAYVRAGGLLLDVEGDDVYIARDDEVVNPSAQTKEHNTSMAQGAGYGRRADFSDGHFMSGGQAFLVDGSGNDVYSTGVFGQAVGYWFGGGYLYDGAGDDEYKGVWYSQAASAHFAIAGFIDVSGDDSYDTLISQCLGNGRDLSNAVFIDIEGDDEYIVPDRSGGCGNVNGFGLFVDMRGDDAYDIRSGISMGRGDLAEVAGNLVREKMDSTGVFIDAGGTDVYSSAKELPFEPMDDASWGIASKPGEMSIGIDGEFKFQIWPVK